MAASGSRPKSQPFLAVSFSTEGNGQTPSVSLRAATRLLIESEDYEATLEAVARLALPDLGAWSIVDLCEGETMRRLLIVHPDPEMADVVSELQQSWPPAKEDPIGAPAVVRTGMSEIVSDVTDELLVEVAHDAENLRRLRQLEIGSFLVVPMSLHGSVLGAITFVSSSHAPRYTEDHVRAAEDLAALAALAIDRARLKRNSEAARQQADDRAEIAERQQRDLEEIMEIQARLVRGVSHDVKNPLGAAQGYVELLIDTASILGTLNPKQRDSLRRVGASIRSALGLIDDLVEYAKSKRGRLEVRAVDTNVAQVACDIAEEYRAQIEARGLRLMVATGKPTIVQSDRVRIRQVLSNFLSNAIKYSDDGSAITLSVETRVPGEAAWPGEWVAVHVQDTGHGIPKEDQEIIFKEFARLEPRTAQGSGLGLAISKWIADALGAHITVESNVGEGSTFTLWLPLPTA